MTKDVHLSHTRPFSYLSDIYVFQIFKNQNRTTPSHPLLLSLYSFSFCELV